MELSYVVSWFIVVSSYLDNVDWGIFVAIWSQQIGSHHFFLVWHLWETVYTHLSYKSTCVSVYMQVVGECNILHRITHCENERNKFPSQGRVWILLEWKTNTKKKFNVCFMPVILSSCHEILLTNYVQCYQNARFVNFVHSRVVFPN